MLHANSIDPPDRAVNAPILTISSVYGDLTFEQAVYAVEHCGIAPSTEIVEIPGICLVFTACSTRFHFQIRWRGVVTVAGCWDHPDLGFAIELEGELPPIASDWLDEEYPDSFRYLPRTALIFASELERSRFGEAVAEIERRSRDQSDDRNLDRD